MERARSTVDARADLLRALAVAIDELGLALAALGEAYELLDVDTADRLEAELFGPVQAAYGQAKRVHAGFADRHGLGVRSFEAASPGPASLGAQRFIEIASAATQKADHVLGSLQDSMLPVEVGDPELRAALTQVRGLLGNLPLRAREIVRRLGR